MFNKQTRYDHSPRYAVHTNNFINIQTCLIHCLLCIASILCFSVWYRPNTFQGYIELLLVTTISTHQFFLTIFAHSTTPINEVRLEPLSPSCRHDVKSIFLLGQPNGLRFCYTQSRSVQTRSSSNIVFLSSRWNVFYPKDRTSSSISILRIETVCAEFYLQDRTYSILRIEIL